MSAKYFGKGSPKDQDLSGLFWTLITANHILSRHQILDAYGHVSVRCPNDSSTFYISENMPPALLSSPSQLIQCKVDDGTPVDPNEQRPEFAEKFIHSEIYRKFKGVNAVVHGHAADVLPFCISGVPLKAAVHVHGCMGAAVPVWDISSASPSIHDLLVRDTKLGRSLAASFSPATSASFIMQKVRAALPEGIPGTSTGSQAPDPSELPLHPVVLMRGHGFTTCATDLEMVVYQAIYTAEAARTQERAMALRSAYVEPAIEGTVDVQAQDGNISGGKIKDAKVKVDGELHYLSEKESIDTPKMSRKSVMRPWALWCREVEASPIYKNEVQRTE